MITEDYVSFETAKLLKEKGFNEKVKSYFTDGGLEGYMFGILRKSNSELEECFYSRPTLQIAMKWLRENFNMNPVSYATSIGWNFEVFDLTQRDITGCALIYDPGIPSKEKMFETHEEAVEAAVRYCLENLI